MPLSPWASQKYYGKRATSENRIEWCKNQMASGSILMVWMMWLNDEQDFKEESATIRMILIHVAGPLQYRGHQWFLRLSRHYAFKERWQMLENSIQSLSFA